MDTPDLNLLLTLDVLLAEGSVARAARRLDLSPSAMSRALARLRHVTADPLLVRAGRGLVPSPRAVELRERVARLVEDARAVLEPARALDLASVTRTFTLRTSDGFVESYGAALVLRARRDAPGVRLRFVQKTDKDSGPLRDGSVDLETGVVVKATAGELRTQPLFRDRFVGVVRRGTPLARGRVTTARYAAAHHVAVARGSRAERVVDEALAAVGGRRSVAAVVGGFAAALALARGSDVVATVPERHTEGLREGMRTFGLPFPTPEVTVSLLWHPRLEADAAHAWLRGVVLEVCSSSGRRASAAPGSPPSRR